jgi:NAD-dependent SIR2 family protein deacetylase
MKSQREGYLFVDHRASPGLDPTIARRMGYAPETVAEGKMFETATLTCQHCGSVFIKNPERTRPRENCAKCGNLYVCDYCSAEMLRPDYIHRPMTRKIDETLNAAAKNLDQFLPLRLKR